MLCFGARGHFWSLCGVHRIPTSGHHYFLKDVPSLTLLHPQIPIPHNRTNHLPAAPSPSFLHTIIPGGQLASPSLPISQPDHSTYLHLRAVGAVQLFGTSHCSPAVCALSQPGTKKNRTSAPPTTASSVVVAMTVLKACSPPPAARLNRAPPMCSELTMAIGNRNPCQLARPASTGTRRASQARCPSPVRTRTPSRSARYTHTV